MSCLDLHTKIYLWIKFIKHTATHKQKMMERMSVGEWRKNGIQPIKYEPNNNINLLLANNLTRISSIFISTFYPPCLLFMCLSTKTYLLWDLRQVWSRNLTFGRKRIILGNKSLVIRKWRLIFNLGQKLELSRVTVYPKFTIICNLRF